MSDIGNISNSGTGVDRATDKGRTIRTYIKRLTGPQPSSRGILRNLIGNVVHSKSCYTRCQYQLSTLPKLPWLQRQSPRTLCELALNGVRTDTCFRQASKNSLNVIGFFYIKNHPIPQASIKGIFDLVRSEIGFGYYSRFILLLSIGSYDYSRKLSSLLNPPRSRVQCLMILKPTLDTFIRTSLSMHPLHSLAFISFDEALPLSNTNVSVV